MIDRHHRTRYYVFIPHIFLPFEKHDAYFTHNATEILSDITGDNSFRIHAAFSGTTKGFILLSFKHALVPFGVTL